MTSTDGRRSALAVFASLGLVTVLTACGGDEPDTEPALDLPGSSSSTGAPSQGTAPSDGSTASSGAGVPDVRPAPEQGDEVDDSYGVWALKLPDRQPATLVAQALVAYMDVRTGAYFDGEAPLADLARVSVGQPLTEVQGYVLDLQQAGQHTVGDFWFSVADRDVKVKGRNATMSDVCAQNSTVNVNDRNVAQESPSDAYLTDATAVRASRDIWLISSISFEAVESC